MEKYKKLCALEAIFWIPNVLKRFMEGLRLHSATSISKKRITLANFLRHLTRFNSKERFTTTLLPRTQTSLFKTCAQRKAGRRQRARLLADLVFKMAGRVMADEYAIFKWVHPCSFCEFWANHYLSTSCVWRGSCFHPTHWTQAS